MVNSQWVQLESYWQLYGCALVTAIFGLSWLFTESCWLESFLLLCEIDLFFFFMRRRALPNQSSTCLLFIPDAIISASFSARVGYGLCLFLSSHFCRWAVCAFVAYFSGSWWCLMMALTAVLPLSMICWKMKMKLLKTHLRVDKREN